MPDRSEARRIRPRFAAILIVALTVLSGAERCPYPYQTSVVRELAELMELPGWGSIAIEDTPGIRVHVYPAPPAALARGTVVEAYAPIPSVGSERLICGSVKGCWVVFIDTDHWAHFAHKVVIALWELDTKEFKKPIVASWWPLVDGKPIFNTVESREKMFLEEFAAPLPHFSPRTRWGVARWRFTAHPDLIPPSPAGISPPPPPTPTPDGVEDCPVWAVIVNGYDDESDTFDEDADGMYAILTANDIPPDHIYYLTALHDDEPCDSPTDWPSCPTPTIDACLPASSATGCPQADDYLQPASYCNLKRVLKEFIPDKIGTQECEEFVLFISTHGITDVLHCGDNLLCHVDLKTLLSDVACKNITVIAEACHSGGLIDDLVEPSSNPPGQKRWIFTSTTEFGTSHQDVDWLSVPFPGWNWKPDPNPGDSGSETTWGYIEAFGTGIADSVSSDHHIAFGEALQFAIENDVMTINALNEPQITPTPTAGLVAHSCLPKPNAVDVGIELTDSLPLPEDTTTETAEPQEVVPGNKLEVSVEIKNETSTLNANKLIVGNVKLYWAPNDDPVWPTDFFEHDAMGYFDRQIGDTVLVTGIATGGSRSLVLDWSVGEDFEAEGEIMIVATIDSPQDPIPFDQKKVVDLVNENNNFAYRLMKVSQPVQTGGCPLGCRTIR